MILDYLVHPPGNQKPKATPLLGVNDHMPLKFRHPKAYSTYKSKKTYKKTNKFLFYKSYYQRKNAIFFHF